MPSSQVEQFVRPENLDRALRALHPGMVVTTDRYVSDVPGYVVDLEWNLFDEGHRIHVHGTYGNMFKVFAGRTFSVNTIGIGRLPILVQVANAKIAPGLFYQCMTILGVIYCHQIISMTQLEDGKVRLDRRWFTASHWIFWPLNYLFNRMLLRLQDRQDREDNAIIRERRFQLRQAGFRFLTDDPDFINSNQLDDHVVLPDCPAESRLDLSTLVLGDSVAQRVKVGSLELLVKRDEHCLRVWPGICPHEGAALDAQHCRDGVLQCPWHGRRFKGTELAFGSDAKWRFLDFVVTIEGEDLVVRRDT